MGKQYLTKSAAAAKLGIPISGTQTDFVKKSDLTGKCDATKLTAYGVNDFVIDDNITILAKKIPYSIYLAEIYQLESPEYYRQFKCNSITITPDIERYSVRLFLSREWFAQGGPDVRKYSEYATGNIICNSVEMYDAFINSEYLKINYDLQTRYINNKGQEQFDSGFIMLQVENYPLQPIIGRLRYTDGQNGEAEIQLPNVINIQRPNPRKDIYYYITMRG